MHKILENNSCLSFSSWYSHIVAGSSLYYRMLNGFGFVSCSDQTVVPEIGQHMQFNQQGLLPPPHVPQPVPPPSGHPYQPGLLQGHIPPQGPGNHIPSLLNVQTYPAPGPLQGKQPMPPPITGGPSRHQFPFQGENTANRPTNIYFPRGISHNPLFSL